MRLLDHFSPPLSTRRHWYTFHNAWATYIASDLNRRLPEGYFAEPNVQFSIEIDVAVYSKATGPTLALMPHVWQPPAPLLSVPFDFAPETVEINLFHEEGGPVLRGAIELVSPANKDRATHRQAFVSKCEAYLQQGLGGVVVDVVTECRANLHHQLLERVAPHAPPAGNNLYASAYRVAECDNQPHLDIWRENLLVGGALPTLPLWSGDALCVPVDLAVTYTRTCTEQRIAA